jgi:alpha-L-fucosidase 2
MYRRWLISGLFLAASAFAQTLSLKYDRPAQDWQSQALPIGNGRLGAMIFGDPQREHLQLNENTLWTGDEKDTGRYQNLADLFVELAPAGEVRNYSRRLDLDSATHFVDYEAGGTRYHRVYFASFPDQVLAFRFTADKPGSYSGTARLTDAHAAPAGSEGRALWAAGKLDNELEYETRVLVLAGGGKITAEGGTVRFEGADSLTILVDAGTNYVPDRSRKWRTAPPHDRISSQLNAAAGKPFDRLLADHVADYRKLFQRLALNLGRTPEPARSLTTDARLVRYGKGEADPELEALFFQVGRYLLISSSRPGGLPANLQGLWNNSNNPPWRSDYHSNINIQMNYWPAEPANLAECALPFLNYVDSLREVRKEATRDYYLNQVDPKKLERKAVRGWTVQTENGIFGGGSWRWNPPGSAWYAQHFWEHYAFTRDKEYLRRMAYPVLKEICEFWEDHLVALPDGRLATPDGWSPEHGPEGQGVTYDQEIVWDLFTNYMEAADALGVDAPYRAKVAGMREKLVKPRVGKWGQLQEWMDDIDDPTDQHRHVSHLFGLHPGRQISMVATPDLAWAAKVSLAARGDDSTGWAIAWRISFWARLADGDHAYKLLHNLMRVVGPGNKLNYEKGGGVYSNLLDAGPPFQIDGNFGATAGIAEMLLQSHAGVLDFLPAVPKAWPDGSVRGLKARGGYTVDLEWKAGKLVSATVLPQATGRVTVRYAGKSTDVNVRAGAPHKIDAAVFGR